MKVAGAQLAGFMVRWMRKHIIFYCGITRHLCPCWWGWQNKWWCWWFVSGALQLSVAIASGVCVCSLGWTLLLLLLLRLRSLIDVNLVGISCFWELFWAVFCSSMGFLKNNKQLVCYFSLQGKRLETELLGTARSVSLLSSSVLHVNAGLIVPKLIMNG